MKPKASRLPNKDLKLEVGKELRVPSTNNFSFAFIKMKARLNSFSAF